MVLWLCLVLASACMFNGAHNVFVSCVVLLCCVVR